MAVPLFGARGFLFPNIGWVMEYWWRPDTLAGTIRPCPAFARGIGKQYEREKILGVFEVQP
jgi:hypothetical protein